MSTPFPGMDPYLEHPSIWPNVHASLIIALRDDLAPRLRPRYYNAVEERVIRLGTDDLIFAARPEVAVIRSDPSTARQHIASTSEQAAVVTVELRFRMRSAKHSSRFVGR